jgi:2-pyrone-4,6-dicarboxylate lactonase
VNAETVEAATPSPPSRALPDGACDCHSHVFGPLDRFPTGQSSYAIPLADPRVHQRMLAITGLSRAVLVQPAPYGHDTTALEAALAHGGGRLRGIAVADASIGDPDLHRLHEAGVRGLRFIEMRDPTSGARYTGSVGIKALSELAPRMRRLGWHAQVWARCGDIPGIVETYGRLGVPLVFDHMGQFDVARGADDDAFLAFVSLVGQGRAWVKLTLCRLVAPDAGHELLKPFHEALTRARPDRILWGSDWPYVRMGARAPDVGVLLDRLVDWTGDGDLTRRILVDNPAGLFGFRTGA